MISLKQLKYALAVERHLHFKKAAEACAISQSALSTALAEMEKHLGFQVFERDNKKVLITRLGHEVLKKAQAIKLQMDDIDKLAQMQRAPLSGPLSIGIIPTICPYILPIVLPALQAQYPELALQVVEEQSHVLVDKVRSGDIDTAILAMPFTCEGLLVFNFWEEDLFWVAHKDNRYADSAQMSAADLKQAKLMLLKDGHCLKEHALAACKISEQGPYSLGATSLSTLVQLVAGKLGTTLLPQMALPQLVTPDPDLVSIHLDEPGPHRRIAFIARPNYPAVSYIERLMALFSDEFDQHFLHP